ncbi:hypothetical protein SPHINGO391_210013 [Sphingomonas aurantiaca]|uniref:Uncharacterized protein n=1 Tax=Sphingomonas aurantiaca TaxID=185949 RepID=A0A5E7XXG1_9SPHN|nr:hypothetical protein SPHINGO391_210013 [Sphingomonas aurantiaca]
MQCFEVARDGYPVSCVALVVGLDLVFADATERAAEDEGAHGIHPKPMRWVTFQHAFDQPSTNNGVQRRQGRGNVDDHAVQGVWKRDSNGWPSVEGRLQITFRLGQLSPLVGQLFRKKPGRRRCVCGEAGVLGAKSGTCVVRQELGTAAELGCGNHEAVVVRTFVEVGVRTPVGTSSRRDRKGDAGRLLPQDNRSLVSLRRLVDHCEGST